MALCAGTALLAACGGEPRREAFAASKGENATGGRDKTSILSDSLEAVFGAIFLAQGLGKATEVIHGLMDPLLSATQELDAELDWKTSLQERSSALGLGVPQYVVEESGPDHHKSFTARVRLDDGMHGQGAGPTKKDAEQQAARTAYAELDPAAGAAAVNSDHP